MKMKNLITVFLMSAGLILASCEKNDDEVSQDIQNLAEDDALVETIFDDVFNTADNAELLLGGGLKSTIVISDSCPQLTLEIPDDALWPKVITVDYGDTECTGFYEQTRKGKIIITLSGPRSEEGAEKTITFDNYYINGIKVEGTKTITNNGFNAAQHRIFTAVLTGGKVILPDETEITRDFNKTYEWVAGDDTPFFGLDDEYMITGTASGVNLQGVSFTRSISVPLHWKRACRFLVAGVITVERTDLDDAFELDYGDGTCDAKAIITLNGVSKEILLRHRHRNQNQDNSSDN